MKIKQKKDISILVHMLFTIKKAICTAERSDLNWKFIKQVSLFMIIDEEISSQKLLKTT